MIDLQSREQRENRAAEQREQSPKLDVAWGRVNFGVVRGGRDIAVRKDYKSTDKSLPSTDR